MKAPGRILSRLAFFFLLAAALLTAFPAPAHKDHEPLTPEETEFLQKHGPVRFISQRNYPPFEYETGDAAMEGMCVELAQWMATELGFTATFENAVFEEAKKAIQEGRADVLTSLFESDERKQTYDFTATMFEVPALIFVKADRPDIKELNDLNGMRVAMQRGDYAAEYLETKGISYHLVPTEDFAQAADMVIASTADAVVGDLQIILHHLYANKLTHKLKSVGFPLYVGQNCMGLKKGSPLTPILRKGIDRAIKTGVIENLNIKWLGRTFRREIPWYEKYVEELAAAAALLLVAALMIVALNVRLRKLVNDRTAELMISEGKYRSLTDDALDTSDVCMVVVGPGGQIVWANSALKALFGIEPEKVLGKSEREVFGPELERARPELAGLLRVIGGLGREEGESAAEEFRIEKSGREPVWVRYWSGAISAGLYKGGWIEYFSDVTTRKNYEMEISREKELWKKTIEAVPEYIAIIDKEYRIIRANKAMVDRLGGSEEEICGNTCYKCIHMADTPSGECPHTRLLSDGQSHTVEIIEEGFGGLMKVSVVPIYGEDGLLMGSVHIARDLTEQKNAERVLIGQRDLNRAIGASGDLKIALGMALDAALVVDGVDAGSAYVVDEDNLSIRLTAQRGLSISLLKHFSFIGPDDPQAMLVAKCLPYYYQFGDFDLASKRKAAGGTYKASVIMPVVHEGKAVAALNLFSRTLPEFGNETKHYLESIALQIAGAINRIKSERKLLEKQESLTNLFENMEDMFFVLDEKGRILHSNRTAHEKLGYAWEELVGMDSLELHPGHTIEDARHVHDAIIGAERGYCPYPIQTKDGRIIPVDTIYTRGEWDGRPAWFGVARDRSEALAQEREMRKELAFRRAIIDSALEGVCVCQEIPDYPYVRFTVWNHKMEELTGYTIEEINRLGWYQTVYPEGEVRDRAANRMANIHMGDDIIGEDWPITGKDGKVRMARINTTVLGKVEGSRNVLAMMTDVTERFHAEKMLCESEKLFRAVVAGNPAPMAVYGEKGEAVFINSRFIDLFGYTEEDLPSIEEWWPLAYPDPVVREELKRKWNELVTATINGQGGTDSLEGLVTCKDGTSKHVEFKYAYAGGRSIVTATDLTEARRTETELRRYAAIQETLLREVNHRVKNNLTAIISMLHMEADRHSPGERDFGIETINSIEGRVRCLFSVHNVLSAAKWQPILITDLVGHILDSTIKGFSHLMRPTLVVNSSNLKVDSDQAHSIAIILNELATNSMKYAKPESGPVRINVNVAHGDGRAILTYRDNGGGFPGDVPGAGPKDGAVGLTLMEGMATTSLGGEIKFMNDKGAVTVLSFPYNKSIQNEKGDGL